MRLIAIKVFHFFFILFFALTGSFASTQELCADAATIYSYRTLSVCAHLFQKDGKITPEFQELFVAIGAPETPKDIESAFRLVQGKSIEGYTWLRTGERFAIANKGVDESQADAIIDFHKKFGFFKDHPIPPSLQGIAIMGSTLPRVREQTLYLNSALAQNPQLADLPIFYIAGERPLSASAGETQEALFAPPSPLREGYALPQQKPDITDERDMVRLVGAQSVPSEFQVVHYVLATKKPSAPRATTADCMELWFQGDLKPEAGVYAIVSSGIFIPYQELVATRQALLHKRSDVVFVGCGPALNPDTYIQKMGKSIVAQILLDNLARIIYEMKSLHDLQIDQGKKK